MHNALHRIKVNPYPRNVFRRRLAMASGNRTQTGKTVGQPGARRNPQREVFTPNPTPEGSQIEPASSSKQKTKLGIWTLATCRLVQRMPSLFSRLFGGLREIATESPAIGHCGDAGWGVESRLSDSTCECPRLAGGGFVVVGPAGTLMGCPSRLSLISRWFPDFLAHRQPNESLAEVRCRSIYLG